MSDLQQAITAIKAGDKATGKQVLIEIIKTHPNNEAAWLWMTQAVNTNQERITCLKNVLKINPNNQAAKEGLATIQQKQAKQQPSKVEVPPKRLDPLPKPEPVLIQSQSPTFNLAEYKEEFPPTQTPSLPHPPLKSLKKEATKRCPYCAETIKAEATVCRFCGKNLGEIPQRASQPQKVVAQNVSQKQKKQNPLLIGLVGIGLLCGACMFLGVLGQIVSPKSSQSVAVKSTPGSKLALPTPKSKNLELPPPEPEQVVQQQNNIGSLNQRVENGGVALTVRNFNRLNSIDIFEADTGNQYVVINVVIENATRDSAPYNPLYFSIKDGDGYEYNMTIASPDPSLKSGELGPGEKVAGNVAFEVPIGARGLVVTYEPMVIFGGYEPIKIRLQ